MRAVIYSHAYGGTAVTTGESVTADRDMAAVVYALANMPAVSGDDTSVVWAAPMLPAGSPSRSPASARTRRDPLLP